MKKQIGFTLIEVMIVVAIIAILAAVIVPKFKVTASVSSTSSKSVPVEAVSPGTIQPSLSTPPKPTTAEECVNGFAVFVHPNGITQKMGIDGKPAVCIQ